MRHRESRCTKRARVAAGPHGRRGGGEECDGGRKGRGGVGRNAQAAEDRRTETARRFVTVTRALASSGGERVRSGVHAVHDQ